jgi:glycosyltransferase involved in cell wall biosynthesis
MRIWLVQRAESTPHDDGGDRRLMRIGILANILRSNGHEVIWWTSSFDHIGKRKRFHHSTRLEVKKSYYIHYLKSFGYKKNISLSRFIDNYLISKQFKKEVYKEKEKPDVILTSIPSIEMSQIAVTYANKNNIPVILDIRDLYPDVFLDLLPKSLSWVIKILTKPMRNNLMDTCKNATAISGITNDFIDWGIVHADRDRTKKDTFFPMAYVKEEISKEKQTEAYSFWKKLGVFKNDKILNVVFIGTFTKSFEFDTIFESAKILNHKKIPIRFIFCGTGIKENKIKESCKLLDNCVFAGWINAAQIKIILKLSDVGIAPYINSKNFIENFPNKPAEYFSENLAVVTSLRTGKLFDFIYSNRCGISYGSDKYKLVSFLEKLSNNQDYLKLLTKNAENGYINNLDGKSVYKSMAEFIENFSR